MGKTTHENYKEGFDALGDVLRPTMNNNQNAGSNQACGAAGAGGAAGTQQGKVLTGDLDSSLASLANNLTINKSAQAQVK